MFVLYTGLVSRVFPVDQLVNEAIKTAEKIAALSKPVVKRAKAAVNAAYETSLSHGLNHEKAMFHQTFGLVCGIC
jgi:enoyl-CoA hydratase